MDADGVPAARRRVPQRPAGAARRGRQRLRRRRERQDGELVQRHARRSTSRSSGSPGTNTVEVVDAIKALLPQLQAQLPAVAARSCIRSDRSLSIRESVHDVKFTLLLTVVLVVLVIFLFLRNLSATIIPSLALPASIVGTFAVDVRCSATASTTCR